MKIFCYSVKLESLVSISDKCFLARSFDGREDLIPKSQVFGQDYSSQKSDAYFISAWILSKKNLQYSTKKAVWINESGKVLPTYTFEKHIPKKVTQKAELDESLVR